MNEKHDGTTRAQLAVRCSVWLGKGFETMSLSRLAQDFPIHRNPNPEKLTVNPTIGVAPRCLPILAAIRLSVKNKARKKLLGGIYLVGAHIFFGEPERFMKSDLGWPRMDGLIGSNNREESNGCQQNDDGWFHNAKLA